MTASGKPQSVLLLLFPVLFFFTSAASAQPDAPFTVGIVQPGGLLVPVATFDGMDWSSPWPYDAVFDEETPSWPDLPEDWNRGGGSLADWTLWFERSLPSSQERLYGYDWADQLLPAQTTFSPTALVETSKWCAMNIALATNLGDRRSHERDSCFSSRKGVATTAEFPPEKVERLDPQGENSQEILAGIEDIFNVIESESVEQQAAIPREGTDKEQLWSGQWLDADRRNEIPLEVREAFRIREANATIYYMEIVRPYQARWMKGCPTYSQLRTWVLVNNDDEDLILLKQDFVMTWCDGMSARWNTPLVFWRHAASIDLLVRQRAYEGESYFILRISNGAATELTHVGWGGA